MRIKCKNTVFRNSPKSLSRNEINKDRRLSLNCSKSRTCTIFTMPVLVYFLKKNENFTWCVSFFREYSSCIITGQKGHCTYNVCTPSQNVKASFSLTIIPKNYSSLTFSMQWRVDFEQCAAVDMTKTIIIASALNILIRMDFVLFKIKNTIYYLGRYDIGNYQIIKLQVIYLEFCWCKLGSCIDYCLKCFCLREKRNYVKFWKSCHPATFCKT